MKIVLTHEESVEFFYDALCNGLWALSGYGLKLKYNKTEYKQSRKKLTDACFEDVLIQMLRDGYKITIVDIEGKGENTSSIGIEEVYKRVKTTPLHHLMDMINDDDDAYTADAILQTVFFNSVVFG